MEGLEDCLENETIRQFIIAAIDKLPARQREYLSLYYGIGRDERMSTVGIAKRDGITPSRVNDIIVKARKRLNYFMMWLIKTNQYDLNPTRGRTGEKAIGKRK